MSGTKRIYFDNAAATPVDPRVNEVMQAYLCNKFGNPSSLHMEGCEARQALELARKKIADSLSVKPNEIVFTGSGTESDNAAIIGIFRAFSRRPFHMITTKIEHPAVLETCRFIESMGANVTYLTPNSDGIINPEDVLKALNPDTRLISIMAANNVTGVFQPISETAALAHEHGVLFHTDAVQVIGKTSIDISKHHIDMMSVSAHKLYGPKGVGALIIREGTPFKPLLLGGGQEEGRRSSTQNVAGIIGFAEAVGIAFRDMQEETVRLVNLRNRLWEGIEKRISSVYLIGHRYRRIPGHLCVGFSGLEGEAIKVLLALDEAGIAISSGSACSAHKSGEPSYVLSAMGYDPFRSRGSLRITLGRFNTSEEIDYFLETIPRIISELRPISTTI